LRYYEDFDGFLDNSETWYFSHYHRDFNDEQLEWLELAWKEYNYEGYIDWDDHRKDDSFWYYWMTEVLGYSDEDIEKYFT